MEVEKIGTNIMFIKGYNGHICQFVYNGRNLIHGGGLPRELRSEEANLRIEQGAPEYSNITVFPYGGNPEKVFAGEKEIINRDQHGLSRSLPWEKSKECGSHLVFRQINDGQTPIKNVRYDPSKENSKILDPMFPFRILRGYSTLNNKLFSSWITIYNPGDSILKYSLWDHPIFISPKNLKKGDFSFEYNNKKNKFNLEEVSRLERSVKLLDGIENISFTNYESGVGFDFETEGFGNLMIWSPEGTGIFSIESKSHMDIEREFPSVNSKTLKPKAFHTYSINIFPFLE